MNHVFQVQGMTCEHCERAVVRAIRQLDQAAQVQADRTLQQVRADSVLSAELLKKAIADEGYVVLD